VHRCAVDLNREENMSVLWWEKNTQGITLTTQKPDDLFKQKCLETYYRPYYKKLQEIAHEFQEAKPFPAIDLHSMPSKPTAYHLQQTPHQAQERPDFCLSDIEGTSCSPSYIHFIAEHLKSYAYNVSINNPYKGGNVTLTMKKMQWQSCQIEIKRSLYMDEKKKELQFNTQTIELKNHLTELFLKLFL
nr:N-formylglutamate amidohydrolase [Bacteriovoracaceae bacterium]